MLLPLAPSSSWFLPNYAKQLTTHRHRPLQARIGIRDHWDSKDSVVKKDFLKLETILGYQVVADPEWQLLLAELHGLIPDVRDQVANIAEICDVWAKVMLEKLDPEAAWTDKVLSGAVNSGGKLRLFLDVDGKLDTAAVRWSNTRGGFVITLPKRRIQPTELFPIFRGQLETCFDVKVKQEPLSERGTAATDDWADIAAETADEGPKVVYETYHPIRIGRSSAQAASTSPYQPKPSAYLPSATSLPKPDELLLKPPYHLHVRQTGRGLIEIHGSHSPSLKLLADYLTKWCRVNHQDTTMVSSRTWNPKSDVYGQYSANRKQPQAITVTLHQSAFALGQMFDRLTLAPHDHRYVDRFQPTVPMLLALIEKQLGYEPVFSLSQGDSWHFRRDVEIVRTEL